MTKLPEIVPGSITAIKAIEERPVYFVALSNGTKLVVKGETLGGKPVEEAAISIHWGSKLMKHVSDGLIGSSKLSDSERAVFESYVRNSAGWPSSDERITRMEIVKLWVKMLKFAELSDADPSYKLPGDTKKEYFSIRKLEEVVSKLSTEQVWRDLGRVVAVDIFNGNQDRITFKGRWQNKGNIMFTPGPTGAPKVVGLDTFDPYAEESNLTQTGAVGDPEYRAALDMLKPSGVRQRVSFAESVVISFGQKLYDECVPKIFSENSYIEVKVIGSDTEKSFLQVKKLITMFAPFAYEFAKGIEDGAAKLKMYLQARVGQGSHPRLPDPKGHFKRTTGGMLPRPAGGSSSSSAAAAAAAASPTPPYPVPPPSAASPLSSSSSPASSSSSSARPTLARSPGQMNIPKQKSKEIPTAILERMEYLGWK